MNPNDTDIFRPSSIDRELKLPPAVRYFQAEPVRFQVPLYESRDEFGRLHNDDWFAYGLDDWTEEWWRHGHAHSVDDRPAISLGESSELSFWVPSGLSDFPSPDRIDLERDARVWCEDGLIHRDGKPAIELSRGASGCKEYWWKGRRHRVGGPAVVEREHTWYYHGLIHRHDGPAVSYPQAHSVLFGDWLWYGEMFSTMRGLGSADFPFHEPPPKFYMTALVSFLTTPELHPNSVDVIVNRIATLMPEFPALWFVRESCDWQEIRRALAICLETHTKIAVKTKVRRKRKPKIDTLPLPDLLFDLS